MKTAFRVLCIIFALATIGQLIGGNFWPIGIILTIVFGYFGWREKESKEEIKSRGTNIKNNTNSPKNMIIFDTETTGLPVDWKAPASNVDNWPRLVQIAWVVLDTNLTEVKRESFIIKPEGFSIPDEATKIHRITNQKAQDEGVDLDVVLNIFESDISNDSLLIAHNIDFDIKVLAAEYIRAFDHDPVSSLPQLCTMKALTNYCEIPGKYGYKWPTLTELHTKVFNDSFAESHDAAHDVEALKNCVVKLARRRDLQLTI